MPKVITALIATAAGLAALLSFRSHSGAAGLGAGTSALAGAGAPQSAPSTPPAGGAPTPGQGSGSGSGSASAAPQTGSGGGGSHGKDGSYTGASENTPYGPVQVRATVSGGRLTDVTVLQVPDNGRYEDQIVSIALPMLHSEALSKQSGNIDIVSGATYTSQGYAQSLQSALDQAGL